ncbi:MAG TPA: hypothetical protein VEK07_24530 [Polyangiaceae bacterium]|nr:hypothetical protein [Polyangiaceae bacterium]
MVRRLVVGLVLGLIVGALLAAGLVSLKWTTFSGGGGALLAYASAVCTGVLTGLVAGKPIWASEARIEATLKAVFGALISAGLMYALRRWAGTWTMDLSAFGAGGPAAAGQLPAVSLPLIGAGLGALFELDNTGDKEPKRVPKKDAGKPGARRRVASDGVGAASKRRTVEVDDSSAGSEPEVLSRHAKR